MHPNYISYIRAEMCLLMCFAKKKKKSVIYEEVIKLFFVNLTRKTASYYYLTGY